jgi:hypothetical protein
LPAGPRPERRQPPGRRRPGRRAARHRPRRRLEQLAAGLGETVQHAAGGADQTHGPADGGGREGARPEAVLEPFGEALQAVGRRLRLPGIARFEELDVIEHLVDLIVGERFQLAPESLAHHVVHGVDLRGYLRPTAR